MHCTASASASRPVENFPLSSEATISSHFVDQTLNSHLLLFQVKDADSDATLSKQLRQSVPVFSGRMTLVNQPYDQNLEDTDSPEFQALAEKLETVVSLTPCFVPFLSCALLLLTILSRVLSALVKD